VRLRDASLLALLALGCDPPHRTLVLADAAVDAAPDADVDGGPTGIGLHCSDEREATEASAGCRGGQRCYTSARGFPGGYCTQDCLLRPCPSDSYCVSEGAVRYCVRRCEEDAECRTAEGYVCVRPSPQLPRGCLPDPSPTGNADGGACVADASLPRALFAGDGESVSHERVDSDTESEPSVAISPVDGTVTVAYLSRDVMGDLVSGISRRRDDGSWAMDGLILDREFNNSINPVIAYDRAGVLWASYLALTYDRPQPAVRLARSADHGATWDDGRSVAPDGRCAGGCDPPWMAIGPSPADHARDRIQVVYLTRSTHRDAWVTAQHSDDAGAHWSAPAVLANVGMAGQIAVEPGPPTVAVDAGGSVRVAWVTQSRANARAPLGDIHNAVWSAVSSDGGEHFEAAVTVSEAGESVVTQPPQVAFAGGAAHVLYVAGTPDARWSVRLASGAPGGAWRSRTVDDDAPCATHGFASLAGDPVRATVHVVWLDNRFGDGEVAYARCPADAALPCGRNEAVSTARFPLSTTADLTRWHGTHAGASLTADGTLWLAWSDTRTGGPAIYAARAR
jgi:hypothetical protein